MALIESESFDGVSAVSEFYAATDVRLWLLGTLGTGTVSFVAGKTANAIRVAWSNSTVGNANTTPLFARTIATPVGTLAAGGWYRISALPSSGNFYHLTTFLTSVNDRVTVALRSDGKLDLTRRINSGGTTTVLATSATALAINTWYFIELLAPFTATAACKVRVDQTDHISATVDTKGASASTTYDRVSFFAYGATTGAPNLDVDDFYCCDTTGSKNNSLLGVVSIPVIRPTGQGNYADWTNSAASASSNNWTFIDEPSTNDADYIQSSVIGDKDSHSYGAVTSPGPSVAAVVAKYRVANTGSGSIKGLARSTGTNALSGDLGVDGTLRFKQAIFELDPASADWTTATVNGAEWGQETT